MRCFTIKSFAFHCVSMGAVISLSAEVSFNRDIRPILSESCLLCHGPNAQDREADLRLDRPEDAYADRDGAAAIVPGDPDNSLMIWMINAEDDEDRMPPSKHARSLNQAEKDLLYQWIEEGARYEGHWAFTPLPEMVAVPEHGGQWAKNEIDHFIAARMSETDLKPSPE
ncbi:MAG: hypothetical protein F7B06_02805 [Opitutae bacterium]|nr:hypothetical protein [Opitutae bacterium]